MEVGKGDILAVGEVVGRDEYRQGSRDLDETSGVRPGRKTTGKKGERRTPGVILVSAGLGGMKDAREGEGRGKGLLR